MKDKINKLSGEGSTWKHYVPENAKDRVTKSLVLYFGELKI